MKIVRNNIIPFKGFLCINLFGVLFVRERLAKYLDQTTINHETIHTYQMRELLYVGFYVLYITEWLFRVMFTRDFMSHKAYRNVSFEREAYKYENDTDHIKNRRLWSMWRCM